MRGQVETRVRSTDHPQTQRAIGRPKMHLIVSAVAKAAGETAEMIRNTQGHILRNVVAWLGWHEGWATLRSIAASLRLRSEGHISNLIKRCELVFSESEELLAFHDAALNDVTRLKPVRSLASNEVSGPRCAGARTQWPRDTPARSGQTRFREC
jgi:hypothetical protein